MSEPITPIPETWRKKVVGILLGSQPGRVLIRQRARRDWAALTSCPFDSALREVLARALEQNEVVGRKHSMDEPGETFSFMFHFGNTQLYGKINLTAPDEIVIVYSAHRPLKGEEL